MIAFALSIILDLLGLGQVVWMGLYPKRRTLAQAGAPLCFIAAVLLLAAEDPATPAAGLIGPYVVPAAFGLLYGMGVLNILLGAVENRWLIFGCISVVTSTVMGLYARSIAVDGWQHAIMVLTLLIAATFLCLVYLLVRYLKELD